MSVLPIRMVLLSPATPSTSAPISILLLSLPLRLSTGVLAYGYVGVPGGDAGKRPATYRRVAVATNVLEKRMITVGGVRVAERVVMECA